MYQLIGLTILILGFGAQASTNPVTPKISQIYESFSQKKTELFKSDLNKKNIKQKVSEYLKSLNSEYEEVKAIENKSNELGLLSTEGNQMAYDIEVLAPLKDLASGLMTKEECAKAKHEHELNFPVIEDEQSKSIGNIINKICSQ